MSADDDSVIDEFRKALSIAGEAISLLSELSEHENLDVQWSSQVARAQTKIADSIRTCKSRLRDMSDLVEYEGRDDIVDVLSQARLDVKQAEEQHAAARRAVASASTRAAAAQKQKLLSGASTPGALSEARKGAGVVSMSDNITASLRTNLRMLTEEVELSKGNLSLIDNTTNKLGTTAGEYDTQQGRLKQSRGLLRIIKLLDRRADILLYCGMAIFGLAIAYVLIRRSLHFVPAVHRLVPTGVFSSSSTQDMYTRSEL